MTRDKQAGKIGSTESESFDVERRKNQLIERVLEKANEDPSFKITQKNLKKLAQGGNGADAIGISDLDLKSIIREIKEKIGETTAEAKVSEVAEKETSEETFEKIRKTVEQDGDRLKKDIVKATALVAELEELKKQATDNNELVEKITSLIATLEASQQKASDVVGHEEEISPKDSLKESGVEDKKKKITEKINTLMQEMGLGTLEDSVVDIKEEEVPTFLKRVMLAEFMKSEYMNDQRPMLSFSGREKSSKVEFSKWGPSFSINLTESLDNFIAKIEEAYPRPESRPREIIDVIAINSEDKLIQRFREDVQARLGSNEDISKNVLRRFRHFLRESADESDAPLLVEVEKRLGEFTASDLSSQPVDDAVSYEKEAPFNSGFKEGEGEENETRTDQELFEAVWEANPLLQNLSRDLEISLVMATEFFKLKSEPTKKYSDLTPGQLNSLTEFIKTKRQEGREGELVDIEASNVEVVEDVSKEGKEDKKIFLDKFFEEKFLSNIRKTGDEFFIELGDRVMRLHQVIKLLENTKISGKMKELGITNEDLVSHFKNMDFWKEEKNKEAYEKSLIPVGLSRVKPTETPDLAPASVEEASGTEPSIPEEGITSTMPTIEQLRKSYAGVPEAPPSLRDLSEELRREGLVVPEKPSILEVPGEPESTLIPEVELKQYRDLELGRGVKFTGVAKIDVGVDSQNDPLRTIVKGEGKRIFPTDLVEEGSFEDDNLIYGQSTGKGLTIKGKFENRRLANGVVIYPGGRVVQVENGKAVGSKTGDTSEPLVPETPTVTPPEEVEEAPEVFSEEFKLDGLGSGILTGTVVDDKKNGEFIFVQKKKRRGDSVFRELTINFTDDEFMGVGSVKGLVLRRDRKYYGEVSQDQDNNLVPNGEGYEIFGLLRKKKVNEGRWTAGEFVGNNEVAPEVPPEESQEGQESAESAGETSLEKAQQALVEAFYKKQKFKLRGKEKAEENFDTAWKEYELAKRELLEKQEKTYDGVLDFLEEKELELSDLIREKFETKENIIQRGWKRLGDINLYNFMEKKAEEDPDSWIGKEFKKMGTVGKVGAKMLSARFLTSMTLAGIGVYGIPGVATSTAYVVGRSAFVGTAGTFGSRGVMDGLGRFFGSKGRKVFESKEDADEYLESKKGWVNWIGKKIKLVSAKSVEDLPGDSLRDKYEKINKQISDYEAYATVNGVDIDNDDDYQRLLDLKSSLFFDTFRDTQEKGDVDGRETIQAGDVDKILELLNEKESLLEKAKGISVSKRKRWAKRLGSLAIGTVVGVLSYYKLFSNANKIERHEQIREFLQKTETAGGTVIPKPVPETNVELGIDAKTPTAAESAPVKPATVEPIPAESAPEVKVAPAVEEAPVSIPEEEQLPDGHMDLNELNVDSNPDLVKFAVDHNLEQDEFNYLRGLCDKYGLAPTEDNLENILDSGEHFSGKKTGVFDHLSRSNVDNPIKGLSESRGMVIKLLMSEGKVDEAVKFLQDECGNAAPRAFKTIGVDDLQDTEKLKDLLNDFADNDSAGHKDASRNLYNYMKHVAYRDMDHLENARGVIQIKGVGGEHPRIIDVEDRELVGGQMKGYGVKFTPEVTAEAPEPAQIVKPEPVPTFQDEDYLGNKLEGVDYDYDGGYDMDNDEGTLFGDTDKIIGEGVEDVKIESTKLGVAGELSDAQKGQGFVVTDDGTIINPKWQEDEPGITFSRTEDGSIILDEGGTKYKYSGSGNDWYEIEDISKPAPEPPPSVGDTKLMFDKNNPVVAAAYNRAGSMSHGGGGGVGMKVENTPVSPTTPRAEIPTAETTPTTGTPSPEAVEPAVAEVGVEGEPVISEAPEVQEDVTGWVGGEEPGDWSEMSPEARYESAMDEVQARWDAKIDQMEFSGEANADNIKNQLEDYLLQQERARVGLVDQEMGREQMVDSLADRLDDQVPAELNFVLFGHPKTIDSILTFDVGEDGNSFLKYMDKQGVEYFLKDSNNVFKINDNGELLIDDGNGFVKGQCEILDGELVASPIEDLEKAT